MLQSEDRNRYANPIIRSKLTKLDNNLTSEVWQTDISGDFGMYQVKGMPNGNIVTHIREDIMIQTADLLTSIIHLVVY